MSVKKYPYTSRNRRLIHNPACVELLQQKGARVRVGDHTCASLQHEFAHPGGLVYCSEPKMAPSRQTLLDGTDDGGGISEPSSTRLRTPRATPPSKVVYINEGAPVSVQNPMVDPFPR